MEYIVKLPSLVEFFKLVLFFTFIFPGGVMILLWAWAFGGSDKY